jgi:four helix bundle protein
MGDVVEKQTVYDLEERSARFAEACRDFLRKVPRNIMNHEYIKQLIRSSASQAANYIEANESLSKKDFCYRIKICRKETKESGLWLRLLDGGGVDTVETERNRLLIESVELRKIYTTIFDRSFEKLP